MCFLSSCLYNAVSLTLLWEQYLIQCTYHYYHQPCLPLKFISSYFLYHDYHYNLLLQHSHSLLWKITPVLRIHSHVYYWIFQRWVPCAKLRQVLSACCDEWTRSNDDMTPLVVSDLSNCEWGGLLHSLKSEHRMM